MDGVASCARRRPGLASCQASGPAPFHVESEAARLDPGHSAENGRTRSPRQELELLSNVFAFLLRRLVVDPRP